MPCDGSGTTGGWLRAGSWLDKGDKCEVGRGEAHPPIDARSKTRMDGALDLRDLFDGHGQIQSRHDLARRREQDWCG